MKQREPIVCRNNRIPARRRKVTGRDSNKAWKTATARAIGTSHTARGIPCQDSILAQANRLPFVIACDGRGSASKSELGSEAGTRAFAELINLHADQVSDILGNRRRKPSTRKLRWKELVHHHFLPGMVNVIKKLSSSMEIPSAEFEFTVSAAVIGRKYLGWIQLGDGGLITVEGRKCRLLCRPQIGEYANQTYFVSEGRESEKIVQSGVMPSGRIRAVYAHTDGLTPRFYDLRDHKPGPAFTQIADRLSSGSWSQHSLESLLIHSCWKSATDDDRSVAVIYQLIT